MNDIDRGGEPDARIQTIVRNVRIVVRIILVTTAGIVAFQLATLLLRLFNHLLP